MIRYLERPNAPKLAYIYRQPQNKNLPLVMFLTGLASDMMGTKAQYLDGVCESIGAGYIRFDFRGHGQSEGRFEDGTIGFWLQDALDILVHLASDTPVILVGSSMGGWVSLLVGRLHQNKIAGIIGLGAAPDFTKDITSKMNAAQKDLLQKNGAFALPSDYGDTPYMITKGLLEDGEKYCVLDAPLLISCPVRLIQGKKDTDVAWQTAENLWHVLTTADKEIIYQDNGDHRLSSDDDLKTLRKTLLDIINL